MRKSKIEKALNQSTQDKKKNERVVKTSVGAREGKMSNLIKTKRLIVNMEEEDRVEHRRTHCELMLT